MFQIEQNSNVGLKPQEEKRMSEAVHKFWLCLLFVTIALTSSCSLFDCSDRVLFEVPSPDGHTTATAFERDCGATTAKNIQIALREKAIPFNSKQHPSFLVYEGETNVFIFWKSATNLTVNVPPNSRLFKENTEINGIKIEYPAR